MNPKKDELIIKQAYNNYYGFDDCLDPSVPEPEKKEETSITAIDDIGNKIINAIHEINNNDISVRNAIKILAAHRHGADTEHSVATVTGIDSWTCKIVLEILFNGGLLDLDID